MPRKPAVKRQQITVVVNSVPIRVTMTPPTGVRTSWYAYWNGLGTSKSTGHSVFNEAIKAVENMLNNGGKRLQLSDAVLSDEEFEAIQRRHYGKRKDVTAQSRAAKSLKDCLEGISAFRAISGISPIATATAADCEQFQEDALSRPRNWRQTYPKSKRDESRKVSVNTVLKWSRQLQAAFDRANKNAGKKCVRQVVDEDKLLTENPWKQFTWIEGSDRAIRQFNAEELISLLDHLTTKWPVMTVATALAKTFLWSWGRRSEVVSLQWDQIRLVGKEVHFDTIGKWGVKKWFRIPIELHDELQKMRTSAPYVFAAYNEQIRRHHIQGPHPHCDRLIASQFSPDNLGDWFYRRLVEWSQSLPRGRAYTHIFRKTSLQYAKSGEDVNREVAKDARLSESVLMTSYVKETDEDQRRASNRTYNRILSSLGPLVATRYGHPVQQRSREELEAAHAEATAAKNWSEAARIASELSEGWG